MNVVLPNPVKPAFEWSNWSGLSGLCQAFAACFGILHGLCQGTLFSSSSHCFVQPPRAPAHAIPIDGQPLKHALPLTTQKLCCLLIPNLSWEPTLSFLLEGQPCIATGTVSDGDALT